MYTTSSIKIPKPEPKPKPRRRHVDTRCLVAAIGLVITAAAYSQEQPQPPIQLKGPEPAAISMAAVSMPALEPVLGDALRHYRRGRFDDAAAKYGAILKQYPNFAEAYAGVARCYLKQEKIQEAYESAAKAVKTAPDSQAAHVALGEVYFRQGKMHDAEDEFLKVVNSVAPEARAYLGLARVSSAISMHARARQMLEKAYALDPDDPEILWRWLNTLEPAERVKALTLTMPGCCQGTRPTWNRSSGRKNCRHESANWWPAPPAWKPISGQCPSDRLISAAMASTSKSMAVAPACFWIRASAESC